MRYIRGFLIKKAPIFWLRNRTTENRKGKKARNIKGKRQSKNFNTVSKLLVEHHSSLNVNHTFQNIQFQKIFRLLRTSVLGSFCYNAYNKKDLIISG